MASYLFGEIVEPTTRALIDEDIDEYPDYVKILPKWVGKFNLPKKIDCLIFAESAIVKNLLYNCVLENKTPTCKLINGGVEIFTLENNQYLVIYSENKQLNIGEIVEALEDWIYLAKSVYAINSDTIYNYQNLRILERPANLIRVLSTTENDFGYSKLEQPNLMTGLGSGILSFCNHQVLLKCTLFIIFIDNSQRYSYNSTPIFEIFKKINLPIKNYTVKDNLDMSNLYM